MGEFKESKDNPLHKDYGLLSNTRYVLGKINTYQKSVLVMIAVVIVSGSLLSIFWGFVSKYVIDIVQSAADTNDKITKLFWCIVILMGIALVLQLSNNVAQQKSQYLFIKIRMRLIKERVRKALHLPYEMLEQPEVLDIHDRCTRATDGNNNGIEGMMRLIVTLGTKLFTVIMTFVSVLVLDWRLILALLVCSVLQFLYYNFVIKLDKVRVWDRLAPVWRRVHYMERVTTNFDAAKDIRLFDMKDFLLQKEKETFAVREERMDYHYNLWFTHTIVTQILFVIGNALIYYVLIYNVLHLGMGIGDFTLFLSFAMAFSGGLLEFLQRFGDYNRASLEVDDFRSFLDLKTEENTEYLPLLDTDRYCFCFENVSYKYAKSESYALRNLSLTIRPGEKLAVVGLNGAGKTTMIKLLLRLYDPTEGRITLNGTDIRSYSREEYFKLFAPVFQDVQVMAFPVSGNVSMKPQEQTDEKKALECLVQAGLQEKIESLPRGIRSNLLKVIEDDGIDLSGGEKQKLALARALYKGAPVIVLDEPTSALDAIAEQRLYESFDEMIGQKTAIYISHRLASTRFCDQIAMFQNGEMVEYGSHDALMEQNGAYASMFAVQAQYYQEEKGEESDV